MGIKIAYQEFKKDPFEWWGNHIPYPFNVFLWLIGFISLIILWIWLIIFLGYWAKR